jgi:nucleoside-diphosphate-sugar epimerase
VKVVVLGATGFIGRHVVDKLLAQNHEVVAVSRNENKARALNWFARVRFIQADMYSDKYDAAEIALGADVIADFIWPGLPNYSSRFHFEQNLPASYRMLKSFVCAGHRRILVAGTCFEFGIQDGCLSAGDETKPCRKPTFLSNGRDFFTFMAMGNLRTVFCPS